MSYKLLFTKQANKDAKKIQKSGLKTKTQDILQLLEQDPFKTPPTFKKLMGDLKGTYSRRINIQHRLIYQVYKDKKIVKIISMWTHYE